MLSQFDTLSLPDNLAIKQFVQGHLVEGREILKMAEEKLIELMGRFQKIAEKFKHVKPTEKREMLVKYYK